MDRPMKQKKPSLAAQAAAREVRLPEFPKQLLDELVKGPMSAEEVEDLVSAFNRAVVERATEAELGLHLGYEPGQAKPAARSDERNGTSSKTLITPRGL